MRQAVMLASLLASSLCVPASLRHDDTDSQTQLSALLQPPLDAGSAPVGLPSQPEASCDLCERDFVLILGTGRSGSTTLLEALNGLPGVHLRGENHGTLWAAFEIFRRALAEGPDESRLSAFEHGPIDEQQVLCTLQNLFLAIDPTPSQGAPPARVRGFKELVLPASLVRADGAARRGAAPGEEEPPEHLPATPDDWFHFAQRLFPCARIVLNFRRDVRPRPVEKEAGPAARGAMAPRRRPAPRAGPRSVPSACLWGHRCRTRLHLTPRDAWLRPRASRRVSLPPLSLAPPAGALPTCRSRARPSRPSWGRRRRARRSTSRGASRRSTASWSGGTPGCSRAAVTACRARTRCRWRRSRPRG